MEQLKVQVIKKISLLAVALFNLGCELEHLGQLQASMQAYQRAKKLRVSRFGQQDLEMQLAQAIRQVSV